MKKLKPYLKPIILLLSGLILMFLFRDKYKELLFSKKEEKDFIIEFTSNYISEENDLLYNINENIDSYIIITANKELNNFIVKENDNEQVNTEKINNNTKIALMINHTTYNSIITFSINDKSYTITTKNQDNTLKINVEEKQE